MANARPLNEIASAWARPTPTRADADRASGAYARGNPTLRGAVQNWPTPWVSASRSSRGAMTKEGQWAAPSLEQMAELASGILPHEFIDATELTPAAATVFHSFRPDPPTAIPGPPSSNDTPSSHPHVQLNAAFVEWLMGLPVGWTDFAPVATRSYRSRLRARLSSLVGGWTSGKE